MNQDPFAKPLPEPSVESQPFWSALNEGRLVIQRCAACKALRHYPRPVCPECYSFDYDWAEASGNGTIHSWTVAHHAFHPGFKEDLPYTLATVDLEEGVRLVAPVRGLNGRKMQVGQAVRVVFRSADGGQALPEVEFV